jgi:Carboxypeptidase regulatory-like domain
MTTVVLVGLIVVLAGAAAYVGVLLVRRWRPSSSDPELPVVDSAPWTVGDLVRMRDGRPLSGADLFTPATGVAVAQPVGDRESETEPGDSDEAAPVRRGAPARAAGPDDLVDGVDVDDAPWRRAARMNGTEPGGAWETAPDAIVPPASREVRPEARAVGTEVRTSAGSSRRDAEPAPTAEPSAPDTGAAENVVELEPVVPVVTEPAVVAEPDVVEPGPAETPEAAEPEPVGVSRPLSDPDLTPLMGIPLVRPSAVAADEPELGTDRPALDDGPVVDDPALDDTALDDTALDDTALDDVADPHADVADAPSGSSRRTEPLPPPSRTAPAEHTDDEVVSLRAAGVSPLPATATGSPQPVWLRVVRRDGEPVADAVVTLLDDRGQQVDATKTAADGGGELRTPHEGRFLLIAGRDGYQPRAVTLAVAGAPVEVALLLPASATLAGLVRDDGRPVVDARVVARQEGEVVDEIVTGPDGSYRFGDLAEGGYVVTATAPGGTAVLRVDVRQSADLHHDLDLVPPAGAP